MPESLTYQRPYLDSSVYIAAIKNEFISGVDRGRIAKQILKGAERGQYRITACTFVGVEVVKGPGGGEALAPDNKTPLIEAFLSNDFIDLVEIDMALANEARQIILKHGLRPADAVHVAAALRLEADVLFRWDDKWPEGDYSGLTVRDPYWWGQETLDV